ncbi:MAG: RNA-protein complex protein Nop10 [Methanocorpusculum sp.]|nr:RNA-protein complex protein Nop10 [Methanocorpusculum sp.]MDD2470858.1 RNA-protein complex protein Nop10 [Methanocorpusculum sp.]MDD3257563.1 RNA-protein complex protein Nop10 [Methanocorpusculum sp.]MDD4133032.1 RNA-protein complex protein Nop10 [Methanocorpusculum sp.]
MTGHIHKCPECNTYTLLKTCQKCGSSTISVHPARYSPEDHYGEFRRMVKSWTR